MPVVGAQLAKVGYQLHGYIERAAEILLGIGFLTPGRKAKQKGTAQGKNRTLVPHQSTENLRVQGKMQSLFRRGAGRRRAAGCGISIFGMIFIT
jgi:hypothetical protein